MTKQEKVEAIREAAREAADLLSQAYEVLRSAEAETGYKFSFQITQELDNNHVGTVHDKLNDIAEGDEDEDIKTELETEDNEDAE